VTVMNRTQPSCRRAFRRRARSSSAPVRPLAPALFRDEASLMIPTRIGAARAAIILIAACGDPVGPGAEWIVGSWRWAGTIICDGSGFEPADVERILILSGDGDATLSEAGKPVIRTQFQAGRDREAAGLPYALRFDEPVMGFTRVALPEQPADVWAVDIDYVIGYRFVRVAASSARFRTSTDQSPDYLMRRNGLTSACS
jgi:hypothetical protein